MKANPTVLISIEGRTTERGTNDYNLALGERLAKAAMNYLVSLGQPADRFTVISYGEEWLKRETRRASTRNRRAHFLAKPQ
jgi:peptidoglycan-associated lipoprotein